MVAARIYLRSTISLIHDLNRECEVMLVKSGIVENLVCETKDLSANKLVGK